ncbi:hypothetical protein FISHEDRAFT_62917 [Fistulina hepatica ATCC 64428]|uniref:Uncharacterized protein n=1 Tax=Fistulina hepatica ATCC 64428 TaxID=1128425 RepID=A0A0D7A166_9AGAR|nr:hypothetical protein FISHEDRAFT_62917 [Fistulina hepatica ATCC 64428]
MVKAQSFFKNDPRVPDKLKERIVGWYPVKQCPATQFQQYGPLNGLLHYVFGPDYLVKPQALFREPAEGLNNGDDEADEDDDENDENDDGEEEEEEDGDANEEEEEQDTGDDENEEVSDSEGEVNDDDDDNDNDNDDDDDDVGNTTIDSMGVAVSFGNNAGKHYPDFAICQYDGRDADNRHPDVVRLLVEVASIGHERKKPGTRRSHETFAQLKTYLKNLGAHGSRWDTKVVGMLIVGHDCTYTIQTPNPAAPNKVKRTRVRWITLYSPRFKSLLDEIIRLPYPVHGMA